MGSHKIGKCVFIIKKLYFSLPIVESRKRKKYSEEEEEEKIK